MSEQKSILEGYRVLDFGRYIAGPFCGALLSDFGAEVIRIERVDGSEDRFTTPVAEDGAGSMFLQMNRNKLGLTLNPMKTEGKEIIAKLTKTADVVIANLPEKTLIAMGLDYESLLKINKKIILTSNTAFGTSGPYADRVGFDGVAQAMSGSMDMSGDPELPTKNYAPYVDFCSASLAAYGTCLALMEREKTGKGQRVKTSLLATALTMTNGLVMEQELLNVNREATFNRAQTAAPSDTFKTKDGWILIATVGQPLFERWANLMGEKEWLEDERFCDDLSRGNYSEIISKRMSKWCAERTSKEAIEELDKARIPVGEVLKANQVVNEPHIAARGLFQKVSYPKTKDSVPIVVSPLELSGNPGEIKTRAPLLGEHTDQILKEIGYSNEEISNLRDKRII
ncbi:MAG: CaiB/BaiF CoA transferase family protein [Gammaproteobacteria bacterium]